jgi:dipicolinate synthase subunit A
MQLVLIGGDARVKHLAGLARARGHEVQLLGHGEITFSEASPCTQVVLPFPAAVIDGMVPSPLVQEKITVESILPLIRPAATVFATKPDLTLDHYIQKTGCTRIDFQDSEAFLTRNAVPSAEGAILALMSRSPACIGGSQCAIIGYGRIGRALALRLRSLGARVTVAARSAAARANAENDGCAAFPLNAFCKGTLPQAKHFRYMINTIPAPVIGRKALQLLPKNAFVVDLASAPYGVDLEAASALCIEAWREPSLPGRHFPETAAAAMLAVIEEEWSVTV